MDAVSDPLIEEVVVMKSAQVGWTEIINNIAGYFIDQDPSPIMVMQPTLEMAEGWSTDRLAPMVRDSPRLAAKIADAKSRDSGNKLLQKRFPGGQLVIVGANSPASLASRPMRVILADEVDRYPASAGVEGDPLTLAYKRTNNFWNRRKLAGSTPTIAGASRIEAKFEESDKRFYFVPCPHCDELSQLFTRKTEEHKDEIATLHDKLQRLEEESPEQKFTRLCVEKNMKIDGLKAEVEKINKEDDSLRAENKGLEKKLKVLEADIKKLQPSAAFTVKEKKTKGKKK
jgi:phage terminase large subunit GpA-like protein